MPVYANLNCFNAGELSPKMLGRNDVSQYSKGCRALRNFLVTPYGAVERRPGTRYVANAKFNTFGIRLIPFVFSSTVAYICEFGANYIRFFRNGEPVTNGNTTVEVVSPYLANEVAALKFVQSADVMTIVHPDHPPMELKRTGENTFTFTEKTYEFPPVLDPNLNDNVRIAASARTGSVTLTATGGNVFESGNVGGYYELVHTRQANEISIDFSANGTSGALEVYGYWTFTTHGTWTGNLTIQRSFDNGTTWSDYRTYSSANDANTSTSGTEDERNVLYRLQMENYSQSGTGTLRLCRCLFVNPDFVTTGVVKITAVTDATHATATVVQQLGDTTATHEWNEGAWSARRGFPCSIAYYEERMVFGGTANNPNRVWASKTGDWDNFLTGTKDDDALDFTLASDTVNTILWMCQHDALVIGTIDSEWTLSASDRETALTPSNFRIKRQSVYGTSEAQALIVGDTILFVQRGKRKVREFVYSWEKDGYSCPDMTILADHISSSGIVECALQRIPDTLLWCVLANGELACLTYEREQEVIGWHRHVTNGFVASIAVIPDGDRDKLYFAVKRGSNYVIEEMCEADDNWYLDSAKRYSNTTAFSTVSGLTHLEGATVAILGDGAVQRGKVVENGTVTLDEPVNTAIVGLAYESNLSPMPIEIETQNGTTLLRNKIVGELRIRVYDSVGGAARCGDGAWQTIISRDVVADNLDAAITPKTEVVRLVTAGGYESAAMIEVRQLDPLPLNVQSIVATYEVAE